MVGDESDEFDRRYFKDSTTREAFRQNMLAAVPAWYSPWGHLAATTGVGLGALLLAITQVQALRPQELLVIPIVLVISNLFEWHAHRNLLHRRWPLLAVLYDRHTPQHHRVYRYGDMQIRSWRELRLVLIPAAGVLGIALTSAPLAALSGWIAGPNVGWLFLMTSSLYVVSYELSHLAYHMPAHSFVGRRAFVRVMREHHARHHDPRLMQTYNFNVTLPLGDWLFGTLAPKDKVREIQAACKTANDAAPELARTPPMA